MQASILSSILHRVTRPLITASPAVNKNRGGFKQSSRLSALTRASRLSPPASRASLWYTPIKGVPARTPDRAFVAEHSPFVNR